MEVRLLVRWTSRLDVIRACENTALAMVGFLLARLQVLRRTPLGLRLPYGNGWINHTSLKVEDARNQRVSELLFIRCQSLSLTSTEIIFEAEKDAQTFLRLGIGD